MESIYEQRAKVFKAFCDERRLRILELLKNGEQCACKPRVNFFDTHN